MIRLLDLVLFECAMKKKSSTKELAPDKHQQPPTSTVQGIVVDLVFGKSWWE